MTKKERIFKKVSANNDLMESINEEYYNFDLFYNDVIDYIKAIKEKRMLCVIHSVSQSGVSRVLSFHSCEKDKDKHYYYRQYWVLFKVLGYTRANTYDGFRVNGCGMDMVFDTNYNNIHTFHNLGFITKKECNYLAQQTPITF